MKTFINLAKRNNSGITLISLVITVTILIILAGISLSMLTDDTGILYRARNASESSDISTEIEEIQIGLLSLAKNDYFGVTTDKIKSYVEQETNPKKIDVYNISTDSYLLIFQDTGRAYRINSSLEISKISDENSEIFSGTGSQSDPFKINCIEDLLQFSYNVGGISVNESSGELIYSTGKSYSNLYINLKSDLDFNSPSSYFNSKRKDFGDVNGNGKIEPLITELTTGSGFIPIGNSSYNFSGNFDGENHRISNLMINSNDLAGLFGYLYQASVTNIKIEKCNIQGESYSSAISAVVRKYWDNNKSSTITNCNIESGTITSNTSHVGSIIGYAAGTNNYWKAIKISDCNNYANISGETYAGGLVGYSNLSAIDFSNCNNYGKITGKDVGGIIAGNYYNPAVVTLYNCNNHGNLTASASCGGIVGSPINNSGPTSIYSCINYGNVTGTSNAAGIAVWNANIYNCINYGDISSTSSSGGIITRRNKVLINSCNLGKVTGPTSGEIEGFYDSFCSKIQNCYILGKYLDEIKTAVIGQIYNISLDLSEVYKPEGMSDLKKISGTVSATANTFSDSELSNTEGLLKKLNEYVDEYNSSLSEGQTQLVHWKMSKDFYPILEFAE